MLAISQAMREITLYQESGPLGTTTPEHRVFNDVKVRARLHQESESVCVNTAMTH